MRVQEGLLPTSDLEKRPVSEPVRRAGAYPANLAIVAWCTSKVLAIARQLSPRDRHRKATEPFGR